MNAPPQLMCVLRASREYAIINFKQRPTAWGSAVGGLILGTFGRKGLWSGP